MLQNRLFKPILALIIFALALAPSAAYAARHPRIDDADIGIPHRFIFDYGQDGYEETSALATGRDVTTFFSFGYNVNERLQARGMIFDNQLSGVEVLFNPLFSNLDSADGWGVEFRIMLEHTDPVIPITPDIKFVPGNSFTIATGFSALNLEASGIDDELHRFYGRLMYSTDFTQELHAHTVFATEHYTSDYKRGNSTTLGLGADYDLFTWNNGVLQLSANGLIDIYSIRKPVFDTGRVTRFDAGLRVKIGNSIGGYAGYEVINDSLSDRNGQGIFYGVTFTPNLKFPTRAKPPAEPPAEAAPAEGTAAEGAPAEGAAPPAEGAPAEQPAESAPEDAGKGSSSVRDNETPAVPPVEIIGNNAPAPASAPVVIAQAPPTALAATGPAPTTTSRIARPPSIENPWEMLPIGYDFHGPKAETKEGVAGPATGDEPAVKTVAKKLKLKKTVSGNFSIFSSAE